MNDETLYAVLAFSLLGVFASASTYGGRATISELYRISKGWMVYFSMALVCIIAILGSVVATKLLNPKLPEYAMFPSGLIAANGFGTVLPLVCLLASALASCAISTDVDRGTIKHILTMGMRRNRIFAAKVAGALMVSILLFAVAVLTVFICAFYNGEMGHLWSPQSYETKYRLAEIWRLLRICIWISLSATLVCSVLAILVSSLIDSPIAGIVISLTVILGISIFSQGFHTGSGGLRMQEQNFVNAASPYTTILTSVREIERATAGEGLSQSLDKDVAGVLGIDFTMTAGHVFVFASWIFSALFIGLALFRFTTRNFTK